jgi:hypothetical protein
LQQGKKRHVHFGLLFAGPFVLESVAHKHRHQALTEFKQAQFLARFGAGPLNVLLGEFL